MIIFYSGSLCGSMSATLVANDKSGIEILRLKGGGARSLRRVVSMATFCSLLGLFSTLVLVCSSGNNLGAVFTVENLITIARMYSVSRYTDPSYREPALSIILTVFIYIGNLLGGYIYAASQKRSYNFIALLTLLPNIFVGLVLTTRASLLFGLILWTSSFLSKKVSLDFGKVKFFHKKNVIAIVGISILIITLMITFRTFRSGKIENFNVLYLQDTLVGLFACIFGSISAFNILFNQGIAHGFNEPAFGAFSFSGPLNLLGIERQSFLEVDIGGGYASTTIHSIFGALIMDYSLVGSLLFFFLLGAVSGVLFKMARKGNQTYGIMLTPIYIYILGSLSNSALKFNNMNLAIVIFIGYFVFFIRKCYKL